MVDSGLRKNPSYSEKQSMAKQDKNYDETHKCLTWFYLT